MNKVIVASYLADKQDEHRVDDIIAGWTGILPCNIGTPAVSHSEVGFYLDGKWQFFSATSRPELGSASKNGTRWVDGSVLLRNPERWLLQEQQFSYYTILQMINRAKSLVGMPYDFVGVVADFVLVFDLLKKKNSIYCSKAVNYVINGDMERISPRQLYKRLDKNGWRACYKLKKEVQK